MHAFIDNYYHEHGLSSILTYTKQPNLNAKQLLADYKQIMTKYGSLFTASTLQRAQATQQQAEEILAQAAESTYAEAAQQARIKNLLEGEVIKLQAEARGIKTNYLVELGDVLSLNPNLIREEQQLTNLLHNNQRVQVALEKVSHLYSLLVKHLGDNITLAELTQQLDVETSLAEKIVNINKIYRQYNEMAGEQVVGELAPTDIKQKYAQLLDDVQPFLAEQKFQQLRAALQPPAEAEATTNNTETTANHNRDLRGEMRKALLTSDINFDTVRNLAAEGADLEYALLDLAVAFTEGLRALILERLPEHQKILLEMIKMVATKFLINELNANPTLALKYAIFSLRENPVKWLLAAGADPQQINVDEIMNLRAAEGLEIEAEAVTAIKDMLQRGATPSSEEPQFDPTERLFIAARDGDKDAAQATLEEGGDLHKVIGMLSIDNQDGRASSGIKFLIELFPDAVQDSLNQFLIVETIDSNNREKAELLISLGADVNFAFAGAVHARKKEHAKFLIELGADPIAALVSITYARDVETAHFIVDELGIDPVDALEGLVRTGGNERDMQFLGAISDSTDTHPEDYVDDTDVPRADHEHPAHAAEMHTVLGTRADHTSDVVDSSELPSASEEVAAKLIKAVYRDDTDSITSILQAEELPVDVVIDDIGTTLLHHAASKGMLKTTTYLIEKLGANPNITNSLNFTPLDTALFFRHQKVAKFLVNNGAISADAQSESGIEGAPTL